MKKNEARNVATFRQETVKLPQRAIQSGGGCSRWLVWWVSGGNSALCWWICLSQIDAVKASEVEVGAKTVQRSQIYARQAGESVDRMHGEDVLKYFMPPKMRINIWVPKRVAVSQKD